MLRSGCSWATAIAARRPAPPPPMTSTSCCSWSTALMVGSWSAPCKARAKGLETHGRGAARPRCLGGARSDRQAPCAMPDVQVRTSDVSLAGSSGVAAPAPRSSGAGRGRHTRRCAAKMSDRTNPPPAAMSAHRSAVVETDGADDAGKRGVGYFDGKRGACRNVAGLPAIDGDPGKRRGSCGASPSGFVIKRPVRSATARRWREHDQPVEAGRAIDETQLIGVSDGCHSRS